MKKYGLEQEFFLEAPGGVVVMPADIDKSLPIDSCGYLIEARGEPSPNIYEAVYSLLARVQEIKDKLPDGFHLSKTPVLKLSKEFLHKVQTKYVKGLSRYKNLYGHINHRIKANERTAGIHLSITDQQSYVEKDNSTRYYFRNFDYVSLFLKLDEVFATDIKAAKRNPGFYEIKDDGRVEYRSLPTNFDVNKLINVLKSWDSK